MNEKGKENYVFKIGSAFDYFCGRKKQTFCLKKEKNERKSQKIWAKVTTYLTPGA
jgi:hypothetical protein